MGVTDDCYTDGRVPSVKPLVIISPTDFIVFTDGISPSVKLDNVVVLIKSTAPLITPISASRNLTQPILIDLITLIAS